MRSDKIVLKLEKSQYLKLPKHWEYKAAVYENEYDNNRLLSICFIDNTRSLIEYNAKPVFYELLFNIDWLWPEERNRIEWLTDVLSRSVLDLIMQGRMEVKNDIKRHIFDLKGLLNLGD